MCHWMVVEMKGLKFLLVVGEVRILVEVITLEQSHQESVCLATKKGLGAEKSNVLWAEVPVLAVAVEHHHENSRDVQRGDTSLPNMLMTLENYINPWTLQRT